MNEILINIFQKEIDNIENTESNYYRIKSLKYAIEIFYGLTFEITSINQIKSIKGVGKGITRRVDKILKETKKKNVQARIKKPKQQVSKY